MAKAYSKTFMPLSAVKEKEFLSRSMGCKGVGLSYVRCKAGQGASYVHCHKAQEEVFITLQGDGTIILDGKRIKMPQGTIVRVAPKVWRALGNDSKKDVVYLILGAIPPKNFPLGDHTLKSPCHPPLPKGERGGFSERHVRFAIVSAPDSFSLFSSQHPRGAMGYPTERKFRVWK